MKLSLVLTLLISITACSSGYAVKNHYLSDQNEINQIQILSSKILKFPAYKQLDFSGLSDLAWDEKQQILYALSDKGILFHLKLMVSDNKIDTVSVLSAYRLKDKSGKNLVGDKRDSEGLDLHYENSKSILSVSFERQPRIIQYTPTGKWLKEVKLPKKLKTVKIYRDSNKALESVINHPSYGVIAASEYPLINHGMKQQSLYSASGEEWMFKAASAKNSAVTALEVLPNNNILVLERAWAGFAHPLVINLSEVMINNCIKGKICSSKNIAKLSTADGLRLDNFEGLTQFKNRQYLMISDDNAKPIQNTILVLFEVKNYP